MEILSVHTFFQGGIMGSLFKFLNKLSRYFIVVSFLLSFSLITSQIQAEEEASAETIASLEKFEWRKVRDLNGIQVFMKHRDNSKIKSFLATTIMDVPDPYSIAAVIEDFDAAPEWMHMISEVTELERISDNKRDVRFETRLPWPVSDRDAAVHATVTQNPENYDIEILMLQDYDLLPEMPGYVRMPEIRGVIRTKMLSGQRMGFEMEFLLDPGGYIPPWMSNVILKDISYHTLKKLRKILLKEKYQNQRSVYESWLTLPDDYYTDSYFHPDEIVEVNQEPIS
jgi:hypothetical protein